MFITCIYIAPLKLHLVVLYISISRGFGVVIDQLSVDELIVKIQWRLTDVICNQRK